MVASRRKDMRQILRNLIVCGLMFCGFGDKSCDDLVRGDDLNFDGTIPPSNLMVCCEFTDIRCGNYYSKSLMEKRPTCYCDLQQKCPYVTIVFIGKNEEFNTTELLWLAYNVPTRDLQNGFTGQSGNEVVIYNKPKTSEAPAGHLFLLYCQDQNIKNLYCTIEERKSFFIKDFASKYGLRGPVAGIYFKVTANGQLMNSTYSTGKCPQ